MSSSYSKFKSEIATSLKKIIPKNCHNFLIPIQFCLRCSQALNIIIAHTPAEFHVPMVKHDIFPGAVSSLFLDKPVPFLDLDTSRYNHLSQIKRYIPPPTDRLWKYCYRKSFKLGKHLYLWTWKLLSLIEIWWNYREFIAINEKNAMPYISAFHACNTLPANDKGVKMTAMICPFRMIPCTVNVYTENVASIAFEQESKFGFHLVFAQSQHILTMTSFFRKLSAPRRFSPF